MVVYIIDYNRLGEISWAGSCKGVANIRIGFSDKGFPKGVF